MSPMDRLKVLINSSTPVSEDCVTDVLEAKKALLKRSEMLEFVDATTDMASVGGLDNLKNWLGSEEIPGTPKPSSSASTHRRASSF